MRAFFSAAWAAVKSKIVWLAAVLLSLAAGAYYFFNRKRPQKATITSAAAENYRRASSDPEKPQVQKPLTPEEIDEELNKLRSGN